jgi:tripartite-type tricarboxylate transporter receptor subunit TctC
LRPLAVTSAKRVPQFPNVPTFAEEGFPGFEAYAWWGIFAPAGTPKPIVERMHAELTKALAQPAVREKLTQQGMDIVGGPPDALAQFVGREIERWAKVVRENRIKPGE